MLTLMPASIMPVLVMLNWKLVEGIGCPTNLRNSSICMGFWLLTPKWRRCRCAPGS